MDAKKLYSEWLNSQNTKVIVEIIENPISSGGFDIKNIENISSYFFFNDKILQGYIKFEKGYKSYILFLNGINSFNNDLCEVKYPLTISIENGIDNLFLLIRENDNNEPIFTISFLNGSFNDIFDEEKEICKF